MIYTQSPFDGGDFVVSVWGEGEGGARKEGAVHNFITLMEVSPKANDNATARSSLDVRIDAEFAIAIQRAWATMLLKTRFPVTRYRGADGWQTEFSVFVRGIGAVYGQLWSPSEGLTKEFMDIGFALAHFCKATEAERIEKRKEMMHWLEDFASRVEQS